MDCDNFTVVQVNASSALPEHSVETNPLDSVDDEIRAVRENAVTALPEPQIEIKPLDIVEQTKIRTKLRLFTLLVGLYLSVFIAVLDEMIIATAIPTITAQLQSASGYFWIGGAYLLAVASASPIWAKCSDIWGRKPAILSACALFAASSIFAALSSSVRMLIAARALQGIAAGGLIQLTSIMISDLFSLRRRALYYGLMHCTWAFAAGVGPLIGGALTQLVGWRWCFWINLPPCGVTFVLLLLFLDVHNPQTSFDDGLKAIDWVGTLTILAATLMLLLGLDFGGAIFPWTSPKVICLIILGTAMIGLFVLSEKNVAKYPLMPLDVFKNQTNIAAFMITFAHGMCFYPAEFYLPLYFQSVKQASPVHSGIMILPFTISEAVSGFLVGVVIHQTGRYKEAIWTGALLLTLGTGLYIDLRTISSVGRIVAFELIDGVGSGFLLDAPLIPVQNTVKQDDVATATATYGFIRSISTAISIVLGGVVFQNSMDGQISTLRSAGVGNTVLSALSNGKAAANVEIIKTIREPWLQTAVKDAFALSLRNIWIMCTCFAALAVIASVFIKQTHMSTEHRETKTGIGQMTERNT